MRHTKPIGPQGQKGKSKTQKPNPNVIFKILLRWYVISLIAIKSPGKLKMLLYQKKNAQRLLVKSEVLLQSFLREISIAKVVQFVAVPRGGIC